MKKYHFTRGDITVLLFILSPLLALCLYCGYLLVVG